MKYFTFLISFLAFLLTSCKQDKQKADLIVHNAIVYTVDSLFTVTEAFAVKDGKILLTGSNAEVLQAFDATETIDAKGKSVFPGFIDAHCHFLAYGLGLQRADLTGTSSFDEVISRLVKLPADENWIIGRGWDQNDWRTKEYPDKRKLDSLFPDTPVMLTRIDGHAALVNSKALQLANINENTKVEGGEILFMPSSMHSSATEHITRSALSGLLIDNAVDLVTRVIPKPGEEEIKAALMNAQKNCFAVGLTTVDDAGLMKDEIDLIDQFQKSGDLKMRIYAMLSDSAPNYAHYLKNGHYKTARLNVRSFKFYGDGALGSRGACLIEDYSDKPGWRGFLLRDINHYALAASKMAQYNFQMNTHCIGDSAARLILSIVAKYGNKNGRWRMEHAQVINSEDFALFGKLGIIPSVQPTHATSDMYWAEERLGKVRIKDAYAYQDLLKYAGKLALGTDFPVEDISPFKTFYAAVERKDGKEFPKEGFQVENALTREQAIRGMTIWAAYANFEEHEKGSIEKGKYADFIIIDRDLMKIAASEILKTNVNATYINGERVFSKNY